VRLDTERLVLRAMRAEDAEPLLGVFGDPRVMAAFASAPFDRAAMDRWVARNLAHQREHGFGLFTVVERGSRPRPGALLAVRDDQDSSIRVIRSSASYVNFSRNAGSVSRITRGKKMRSVGGIARSKTSTLRTHRNSPTPAAGASSPLHRVAAKMNVIHW